LANRDPAERHPLAGWPQPNLPQHGLHVVPGTAVNAARSAAPGADASAKFVKTMAREGFIGTLGKRSFHL
jgi:hypothetical protein